MYLHASPHELDGCCALWQVEKAPIVIKSGMKKEDAEALKLKLEAGVLPIHPKKNILGACPVSDD